MKEYKWTHDTWPTSLNWILVLDTMGIPPGWWDIDEWSNNGGPHGRASLPWWPQIISNKVKEWTAGTMGGWLISPSYTCNCTIYLWIDAPGCIVLCYGCVISSWWSHHFCLHISFMVVSLALTVMWLPLCQWSNPEGYGWYCLVPIHMVVSACHGEYRNSPYSKVHGANIGPTWFLSAPDGPHVGPV